MMHSCRVLCAVFVGMLLPEAVSAEGGYRDFAQAPHDYFLRTPTDRFTRLKAEIEFGRLRLDRSDERAFVRSLLDVLGIPVSSQMLVFSTTSLQLSRISPSNPRALYFTEDIYLGYIPGGRLELASLDPDLGAVFYIFDVPRGEEAIQVERATRCMNCHAGEDTGHVPGLVVKSVVPGPSGGSLDAFRLGQTGHGIPWEERFGGWYLTGQGSLTNHWANAIGRSVDGVMARIPNSLNGRVNLERYLAPTSDLLAQWIHEHQVGFVNRVVGATYRARAFLQADGGVDRLSHASLRELEAQAGEIVRYLLFADEVPLPADGLEGDPAFKADFLRTRREAGGRSLKDFELKTRVFENRCSYMIYSPVFAGLPPVVKDLVNRRLGEALGPWSGEGIDPFAYLPMDERRRVRGILQATLPDLGPDW